MKTVKRNIGTKKLEAVSAEQHLFSDIVELVEESRKQVARTVNSTLLLMYWKIGKRINEGILENTRAGYGQKVVNQLAKKLKAQFGSGWGEKQLRHCLRSAETFSEEQIVYAVRRELSWTHVRTIAYLDDDLQREFYLQMSSQENWSSRQLQERIGSMLFERTAISKKPEKLIKQELRQLKDEKQVTPDLVFRDPYVLDFLGLKDTYSESDLEIAILRELERFILELGQGFAFMERQKRMVIDSEDFYLDLLFYHRKLKRLVAIELKLGKFKAAYKAQMELYLRWLEKHETEPDEQPPLGLLLCTEGSKEQIELLQLHSSGIRVAEYITGLPDKKILKEKLHRAIEETRKRFES